MSEATTDAKATTDNERIERRVPAGIAIRGKIAGALIIVGYLAYGIADGALLQPLLGSSDPLGSVAANTMQLNTAALMMAINAPAVVGISLMLYTILKQHSEWIALSYIATRLFEAIIMVAGSIFLLVLGPISQVYAQASAADAASLQAIGTVAIEGNLAAYHIGEMGLAIGSLPFVYLLYQTKLVPRVISVLGFIGYPALLILMLVETFGFGVGPMVYTLYIPGMMFELGLALWLIFKGFNPSAIVSKDSSADMTEVGKYQIK